MFYFITFIVGYILSAWHVQKVGSQREKRLDILQARDAMLFRWHNNYYQGIKLADQLRKRNIHSVAICGIGNVGLMLYDELYNSEIEVKYTVDKTGNRHLETAVRGYTFDNITGEREEEFLVDAVLVSERFIYEANKGRLEQLFSCPIIVLEDLIYEE